MTRINETVSTALRRRLNYDILKSDIQNIMEYEINIDYIDDVVDFVSEVCNWEVNNISDDMFNEHNVTLQPKEKDKFYSFLVNTFSKMIAEYFNEEKGKLKESKKRIIVTESQYKKILKETERLDEVGELIAEFINNNLSTFEGQYYSPFDEIMYDVYIEYHTNKVSVWNEKDIDWAKSNYYGTVYITIDRLLVGIKEEDTWERMYGIDDIPGWLWDEFTERISEQVNKYFDANVDCDITFKSEKINESILIESTLPDGMLDLLFDVVEDYKDSCDFFEDSLEYVESIIDYTISRAVSQEMIEPTSDEYIDSLYEELFNRYGETLMGEYESICENDD